MIVIPSAYSVPPILFPDVVPVPIVHNRSRPDGDIDFTIAEYSFIYLKSKLKGQDQELSLRLGVGHCSRGPLDTGPEECNGMGGGVKVQLRGSGSVGS